MTYYNVLPRPRFSVPDTTRECDWAPPVNIVERDDAFVLTFDLPGVDKESIKATVEDGLLTVRGERTQDEKSGDNFFSYRERPVGKFERTFRLHDDVDGENINGTYTNGVLKLELRKKEELKPRTIKIR